MTSILAITVGNPSGSTSGIAGVLGCSTGSETTRRLGRRTGREGLIVSHTQWRASLVKWFDAQTQR